MEIKSKFERNDFVFTTSPFEEVGYQIRSYIVVDVVEYRKSSGFTYKLLNCERYKRAVRENLTIHNLEEEFINHDPFEYIRECHLYKSKDDYLQHIQDMLDLAEKEKKEMDQYPSLSDFFKGQLDKY